MENHQLTRKEKKAIYNKKYREDHKEEIREKKAIYNKTYREDHKDELREAKVIYMQTYNPKYREEHKDDIVAKRILYMQKQIVCSCGMTLIRNNLTQHLKTKKHTKALDEQNQEKAHQSE